MSRQPLGISWDASHGRWKATVRRDGKTVHLGHYLRRETALEAARTAREPLKKSYRVRIRLEALSCINAYCPGEARDLVRASYTGIANMKIRKVTAHKVRETKP